MPAYDLRSALQQVSAQRQNFGLFRGEEGDQILITAAPATEAETKSVQTLTGEGRRTLWGICFLEAGRLVFASRHAAPVWEKVLARVLQQQKCEQFLPLTLRPLAPGEPDEVTGREAPPAQPQPTALATSAAETPQEQWERFKSSLMPQLRAAMADPVTKAKVSTIVTAASAKEKAGAYAEATTLLQRLATVLGIPVEATPTPTPAPEPPVPAVTTAPSPAAESLPSPEAGQLQAAMNALAPAFEEAITTQPARRAELLQPVRQFQAQLAQGQVREARETLRQVSKLLQAVLPS